MNEQHESNRMEELGAELGRLKQWRSDVDLHTIRTQRDLRVYGEHADRVGRKVKGVGILVGILASALIALSFAGYEKLRESELALDTFPNTEDLVELVDARVDFVAEMLADFSVDGEIIQGLADEIRDLESMIEAGLAEASTQTEQVAVRIGERVQLEVLRRFEEIRPTLVQIAASQDSHHDRLAELDQELASVRSEMRSELAELRRGTSDAAFSLAQIEGRVSGNERALGVVSYEIGRERIGFELYEDFRQEIAPGLAMHVSDIDVNYQKVGGWLHLVKEGRILRIKDHAVQRSLVFYSLNDDRSYEVVFTRLTPDAAFGYVVVPTEEGLEAVHQVQDPAFDTALVQNP